MAKNITTVEQVKAWFEELRTEGLNFHPDTPFDDYIDTDTKAFTYGQEAYEIRNNLLSQCFEVCKPHGEDYIYQLCIEVFDPLEALDVVRFIDLNIGLFPACVKSYIDGKDTYRDQVLKENLYNIDNLLDEQEEDDDNLADVLDFLQRIKRVCDKHEAAYFRIITP